MRTSLQAFGAWQRASLDAALHALVANGNRHGVDVATALLSDQEILGQAQLLPLLEDVVPGIARQRLAPVAELLLGAPDAADVLGLLRAVWEAAAEARDEGVARLVLDTLSSAPADASPIPKRLDRMRGSLAATEFESRVLPYLQSLLALLSSTGKYDTSRVQRAEAEWKTVAKARAEGQQAARAASSVYATTALARLVAARALGGVDRLDPITALGDLPPYQPLRGRTFPFVDLPPPRTRSAKPDGLGILMLLGSLVPFAATFFIPGDVPEGAGLGQLALSRFLSLLVPASLLVAFAQAGASLRSMRQRSALGLATPSSPSWTEQFGWVVPVLAMSVSSGAHEQFIGPLSFGPQAIFFVLDLVAVCLAYFGWQRLFDD